MRALADAALHRARELGAEHADFRLERIRNQTLRLSDARLETAIDADDVGFAVRVVKDGTWGFAAGIDLTTDAAARVAEQAVEVAKVAAAINRERDRAGRRAGARRADLGLRLRGRPVRRADGRQGRAAGRLERPAARRRRASPTSTPSLLQVKENKFYADAAGTVTTQQRVRLHPVARRGRRRARRLRHDAHPGPAGRAAGMSTSPAPAWDWDAELAALPELLGREARRALGRGRARTTW